MNNPDVTEKQKTPAASTPASGSADWRYNESDGVNMWTWKPKLGVTYMVTQHGDNIQAHLTTGTRYKYCRTIGAYATVKEAKARAEEHRPNAPDERRPE